MVAQPISGLIWSMKQGKNKSTTGASFMEEYNFQTPTAK
jgi:hypothetical protein